MTLPLARGRITIKPSFAAENFARKRVRFVRSKVKSFDLRRLRGVRSRGMRDPTVFTRSRIKTFDFRTSQEANVQMSLSRIIQLLSGR